MKKTLLGLIIVVLTGIGIAYYMISNKVNELNVYNPVQLDPKLVASELRGKMSGHRIGPFNLQNQYGEQVTEEDFKDKIYVADFFFTTCPGICPVMSKQMVRVQEANEGKSDFRILSHTVQPEVDTPPVLLEYAKRYDANPELWQFVTGPRSEINSLARKSYFAATLEEGQDENDMVHTQNFVLIDKEKRIRGIYDGTSEEEVTQLITDIELLRSTYNE